MFALYIKKTRLVMNMNKTYASKMCQKMKKLLETQEVQFYGQLTRRGS